MPKTAVNKAKKGRFVIQEIKEIAENATTAIICEPQIFSPQIKGHSHKSKSKRYKIKTYDRANYSSINPKAFPDVNIKGCNNSSQESSVLLELRCNKEWINWRHLQAKIVSNTSKINGRVSNFFKPTIDQTSLFNTQIEKNESVNILKQKSINFNETVEAVEAASNKDNSYFNNSIQNASFNENNGILNYLIKRNSVKSNLNLRKSSDDSNYLCEDLKSTFPSHNLNKRIKTKITSIDHSGIYKINNKFNEDKEVNNSKHTNSISLINNSVNSNNLLDIYNLNIIQGEFLDTFSNKISKEINIQDCQLSKISREEMNTKVERPSNLSSKPNEFDLATESSINNLMLPRVNYESYKEKFESVGFLALNKLGSNITSSTTNVNSPKFASANIKDYFCINAYPTADIEDFNRLSNSNNHSNLQSTNHFSIDSPFDAQRTRKISTSKKHDFSTLIIVNTINLFIVKDNKLNMKKEEVPMDYNQYLKFFLRGNAVCTQYNFHYNNSKDN